MAQEATQEVGNLDLWPCTYAERRGICCDENGSSFNESRNFALRCHREGPVKLQHITPRLVAKRPRIWPCDYWAALNHSRTGSSSPRCFSQTLQSVCVVKNASNNNNNHHLFRYSSPEVLFAACAECSTSASVREVLRRLPLCCFFTQAQINCQVLLKGRKGMIEWQMRWNNVFCWGQGNKRHLLWNKRST